jgi:site-specific recombinase XerD
MLDTYPIWPHIRARLEAGPLGPYLDGFVAALRQTGYSPGQIRRHLHAADRFGGWRRRHGIVATAIDEAIVARFIAGLGRYPSRARPRGRLRELASGVHRLGTWLWEQAIAPRHLGIAADTAVDRWLRTFDAHLGHVAGLAAGTRHTYLRYARTFLQARFGARAPAWAQLTADDLTEFVRVQAARLKPSASRMPVTAVRAMVRFLATTGAVRPGLTYAVPTVRQWQHTGVPAYLSPAQVTRVLAGCARATPVGRRDRAILLVLVRLGLRAGEVAALCLDDLDWRQGCLRVCAGKGRRERVLPLPAEVGQALVHYLRGRPTGAPWRAVFLRVRPPLGPVTAGTVSDIARRALVRAGVGVVPAGAHALRHTLATTLVRRGVTFKAVADLLGHTRLQTTAIYAKLDLDALARVALPWPGGPR